MQSESKGVKNMKWKRRCGAGLLAAMLFSASCISAQASVYPDIERHWAKSYIEQISENRLISGYEDGRFRPDNEVSRLEAIIMICNLFPMDQIEEAYATHQSKWLDKFRKNNIPDWSWKHMVFALEKKIIPDSDAMLGSLMSKTSRKDQIRAFKYEAVVFLVNALGWTNERSAVVVLKYKDTREIDERARPYIDVLIRKGIIGETGDNNGNFGAKKGVTRGEMALMLANAYKHSEKSRQAQLAQTPAPPSDANPQGASAQTAVNPPSQTAPVRISQTENLVVIDGKVSLANRTAADVSLVVTTADGKTEVYTNRAADVQVRMGNTPVDFSTIQNGDRVRLLIGEGRRLMSVILDEESLIKGSFVGAGTTSSIRLKVGERVMEYPARTDLKVTLDGKPTELSDIREQDSVELYLVDGKAAEIRAFARERKNEDKQNYNLKNALIREIRLTTAGNRLFVEDVNGRTYEFEVTDKTAIRYKNLKEDIQSLRVGYLADIYATGSHADEVLTEGNYKLSKVDGRILSVDESRRLIEIEASPRDKINVYYDSRTVIEDIRGFYLSPSRLYKGDKISVTGYQGVGGIDAQRIILDIQSY